MELIFWILIQNSNKLLYLSYFIEQNYLIVGFLHPRMLLLYCCLLQAKKSGGEQRMCWCLRENSKGETILSCWLRTIHIYCNLKYVCVCMCAHARVCCMNMLMWAGHSHVCACDYDKDWHQLLFPFPLYFYFLRQNLSWNLELPVWIRLSGPQVPKIHPCCHQPFIQHWGYSLCVGFYMGAEGSIADASGCTANTLPMEPTP